MRQHHYTLPPFFDPVGLYLYVVRTRCNEAASLHSVLVVADIFGLIG
jgi:hypothetical protein